MAEKEKKSKKIRKKVTQGIVHIKSTFNNTIVSITDLKGNALTWASAGALNFRGAKKSTPFAAQLVSSTALEASEKYGLQEVLVRVKGPGFGRESAIKSIGKTGLKILEIRDVTGVPHNGCRPPKQRNP